VRKSILWLATAATTVALLAGCGSSKSSTSASAPAATGATTSTSPSTSTAASSTTASASAVVITTKHGKYGTILAAGPKKMTVYMFEADKGSSSSCTGPCAKAWPPVTSSASASATGAAATADLGRITRTDGTTQVTYKGHPLYFFASDKDEGDAYGQGVKAFGADWYVLKPTGEKVDES